jgi:gentisate 1,2-dioxygenase
MAPRQAEKEREQLDERARDLSVVEYWKERHNLELLRPAKKAVPHVWKWADLYPALIDAAEIVPLEEAERRSLLFSNPSLFPKPFFTTTLYGAFSIYNPGEPATVHRHSVSASRFAIEGEGAFTTVEGEKCTMSRGDLVITPSGTWHDHGNDGKQPTVWLDMLDLPLVENLNSTIFEFDYTESDPNSNSGQPVRRQTQTVREPHDHSQNLYGAAGLRPTFLSHRRGRGTFSPQFIYRWAQVRPSLERLKAYDGSPYDGIIVEYVNPVTGSAVMPTLSFTAQLLRPREQTQFHRHTASTVYCVVEGEGETIVDDTRLEWQRNDVFVIPSWAWHAHTNKSATRDAVLYAVSDAEALRRLDLYREQGRTASGDIVPIVA